MQQSIDCAEVSTAVNVYPSQGKRQEGQETMEVLMYHKFCQFTVLLVTFDCAYMITSHAFNIVIDDLSFS